MPKAIVQLTYRQIIDQRATGSLERTIFNQSFTEFTFKSQEYNPGGQYVSLAEMINNNPKANSLHYKVALSIVDTMKGLQGIIPGLVNSIGVSNIPFASYEMRIIESNPINQADHVIAIDYLTPWLILLEVVGGYLLLGTTKPDTEQNVPYKTFMVAMQPYISVSSYRNIIQV